MHQYQINGKLNLKQVHLQYHQKHKTFKNNFFSFFYSIQKFPSQQLNLSHGVNLHHSCGNARSLTHCAGLGTELTPLQRQCQILNPQELPRINLTKDAQELYNENDKILLREVKEMLSNGEIQSLIGTLGTVKISILPKLIYTFNNPLTVKTSGF